MAQEAPKAQFVRWGPVDGLPKGAKIWNTDGTGTEVFIAWDNLKEELEEKLLPQLFANPAGYSFILLDHHGKKDWLARVVDENNNEVSSVWLGPNPENGWAFDGLVRLGAGDPAEVWQTYQRYSDGTYRRLTSKFGRLEDALAVKAK